MPCNNKKKTFKIYTLGCKINQWESAYFRTALGAVGWKEAGEAEPYDVAIVNTCIVTQKASHQSRQIIRRFIRNNPSALVVVTGCYAQVYPDELRKIKGVDLIVGNSLKHEVPDLIDEIQDKDGVRCFVVPFRNGQTLDALPVKNFANRTRAYLKVQDGCESNCSYCIVSQARGPYRSMEIFHILESLKALAMDGFREVVLTGIHLGKYGVDLRPKVDLVDLLEEIGRLGLPMRIRLSSIEPAEISDRLIGLVASERWLCRHFHIPLQSGDTNILKAMNRTYSPSDYEKLILRIKKLIPLAAIGADVMVGFPGEGDREFRNTYELIEALPISYLHVFPFSPRKGTPAAGLKKRVSSDIMKERAKVLRDLGARKRREFWNSCLNHEFEVLVEAKDKGPSPMVRGLTDNYINATFTGENEPGDLVTLLLKQEHLENMG